MVDAVSAEADGAAGKAKTGDAADKKAEHFLHKQRGNLRQVLCAHFGFDNAGAVDTVLAETFKKESLVRLRDEGVDEELADISSSKKTLVTTPFHEVLGKLIHLAIPK